MIVLASRPAQIGRHCDVRILAVKGKPPTLFVSELLKLLPDDVILVITDGYLDNLFLYEIAKVLDAVSTCVDRFNVSIV